MNPALKLFSVLTAGAFFAGCATTTMTTGPVAIPPQAQVAQTAAPTASVAPTVEPSVTVTAAPTVPSAVAGPILSTAATRTVQHLSQPIGGDALPHELVDTSSFPQAVVSLQLDGPAPKFEFVDTRMLPPPQGLTAEGDATALVVRDWTGLVLVPINTALSKAHTSSVRLLKVEAHPLQDGRVRVWIRVRNISRQDLSSDIACTFRMQGSAGFPSPNFYELQVPARGFRDVFFVSPEGQLTTYTVLVRPRRE